MTWSTFRREYLVKFWAPLPAIIAAGLLSAVYFGLTSTFWAVTGEFTRWGGEALQAFGLHPENWGYFKIVGLDGSPSFAAMARSHSGCEVWCQDFLALDLPAGRFDGIFANASMFHIPSQDLPRVLAALRGTLKPGGVLFCSNPRGNNEEGWNRGRYGVYHDLEQWRRYLDAAGFDELEHYYRPAGLPRVQQPWLATVWRRRAAPME